MQLVLMNFEPLGIYPEFNTIMNDEIFQDGEAPLEISSNSTSNNSTTPIMMSQEKVQLDRFQQPDFPAAARRPQQKKDNEEEDSDKKGRILPTDFVPSPYSVLFGRGKKCSNACGNQRLRVIASMYLSRYTKAESNKDEKSEIVSEIYNTIKEGCPDNGLGAFVRNVGGGRWIEVETTVARERISQVLRDLLHTKYRSSMKTKIAIRRKRRIEKSARNASIISTDSSDVVCSTITSGGGECTLSQPLAQQQKEVANEEEETESITRDIFSLYGN